MCACDPYLTDSSVNVTAGVATKTELADATVLWWTVACLSGLDRGRPAASESGATNASFLGLPRERGWQKQHLVQWVPAVHLSQTGFLCLAEHGRDIIIANNLYSTWVWVPGESTRKRLYYENEVSCERFTGAVCYWVSKHVYRHLQMYLKSLQKKVYHRKTGNRVCLN